MWYPPSRQLKPVVEFSGSGRLRNQPFTIEGAAASVLALEHQQRPYALNVSARAGATSARFQGTIVPAKVDNVDGMLTLEGRDLSELYPIIPVPMPWTPPYRMSGQLKHNSHLWTFARFNGSIPTGITIDTSPGASWSPCIWGSVCVR